MTDGEPELRFARMRWRAAEDQLYPLVTVAAESYQRAVATVGLLLEELRGRTSSLAELLAVERDPNALFAAIADRRPLHDPLLSDETLLRAACSARSVELATRAERERRLAAIAAARESGAAWVELVGTRRDTERSGAPSIEMHLPSGRAVQASVDPYSGGDAFGLREVRLDPATGEPVPDVEPSREAAFAEQGAWREALATWRAEIEDEG